jgi:hypothetical protein
VETKLCQFYPSPTVGVETKLPRFTIPTHTDPRHTAHTAVSETNPLQ